MTKVFVVIKTESGIAETTRTIRNREKAEGVFKKLVKEEDESLSDSEIIDHLESEYFDCGNTSITITECVLE